jgi:hypothetical protein
VKPALLLVFLALLVSSCGGHAQTVDQPESAAPVQTKAPVTPASHVKALVWVKRCHAALATLRIGRVTHKEAPAAKKLVAKAIAACDKSDDLYALLNANRADNIIDGAYQAEQLIAYGLGNFQKYVSEVAAGKKGRENILGLAQEQMNVGKTRLATALVQLPYPP